MKYVSPRALPKHLALEQRRPGRRDTISELGPRIGARPCQLKKGKLKDEPSCAGGWETKINRKHAVEILLDTTGDNFYAASAA